MSYSTMSDINDFTIFDEIVNFGISEEDSVVNLGAGHLDGKFLETLQEYNGTLGEGLITAVDVNPSRVKTLQKKFKGERVTFIQSSLQDYIDGEPKINDWIVVTGIFDNDLYGTQQYEYVTSVITSCLEHTNNGVIFSIKENVSTDFKYSMIYFFTDFANTYDKFTVKKFGEGNYVFCIFK